MFSPNFSIIGSVRVLHLPKVEGVKIVCFFHQSKQNDFLSQGLTLDQKNKKL